MSRRFLFSMGGIFLRIAKFCFNQYSTILRADYLFQQYIVDCYAFKINKHSIFIYRRNQKTIRVDLYQNVQNALFVGDHFPKKNRITYNFYHPILPEKTKF